MAAAAVVGLRAEAAEPAEPPGGITENDPAGTSLARSTSRSLAESAAQSVLSDQREGWQLQRASTRELPGASAGAAERDAAGAPGPEIEQGRQHVEEVLQEGIGYNAEQHHEIVLASVLLLVCLGVFVACVSCYAIFVVLKHYVFSDKVCDQPLGQWVIMYHSVPSVRGILRCCCFAGEDRSSLNEAQRIERIKKERKIERLHVVLLFFTMFLGIYFVRQSETCEETNPGLYGFVSTYVWFVFILHVSINLLVVILYCAFLRMAFLARLAKTSQAAADDTFDLIPLVDQTTIQIDEVTFENTCCVCLEELLGNQPVKKTPCDHMIHADCLKSWLDVGKTCPMCRTDLDVACRESAVPV